MIPSTDGQTDRRTRWNQYTPPSTSLSGGYDNHIWMINPTVWSQHHKCNNSRIVCLLKSNISFQGPANPPTLNSLAPGTFAWHFRQVIFKQILVIDGWGISCEISLIWMSLDFTDDQSMLVQVMAWCHQATSHYLRQCWPRSLSPYCVTRPQWVKS